LSAYRAFEQMTVGTGISAAQDPERFDAGFNLALEERTAKGQTNKQWKKLLLSIWIPRNCSFLLA